MYWAAMGGDGRLVGTVRRAGAVRPGARLWELVWLAPPPALQGQSRLFSHRHDALRALQAGYPSATLGRFSERRA